MRYTVLLAAALIGMAASTHICPAWAQLPMVEVREAWARATTSTAKVGGVFLTMTATGGSDRMVSASSPLADRVELHETIRDGDVMKMREVLHLPLEPGLPTVLKPGAYHIMLIGLKRPLHRGETFPVTIMFDKAPSVTTTVTVRSAGDAGPGHRH